MLDLIIKSVYPVRKLLKAIVFIVTCAIYYVLPVSYNAGLLTGAKAQLPIPPSAPNAPPIGSVPTIWNLYQLFIKALDWFFAFSIVVSIIIFIYIGLSLMSGGGNSESRKNYISKLYWTAAGVGIIFFAWIIVTRIIPSFLGMSDVSL